MKNKGIEKAIDNISAEVQRIAAGVDPKGNLEEILRVERGLTLLLEARRILRHADDCLLDSD